MGPLREVKTLNVARELKGLEIRSPATGEKLGEATDVLIHPTEGRFIGIVLRTPGGETRTLAAADSEIGGGFIRAGKDTLLQSGEAARMTEGAYHSRDVIGAFVVTDKGKLLGRVSEVHVSAETRRAYYRVARSELQRLMGGGFFMPGDVPHSYFDCNSRLIVPADAQERYAAKSPAETSPSERGLIIAGR